jgi:CelD/BcsL family acetyltransferase involved in cellulose biosynthesis
MLTAATQLSCFDAGGERKISASTPLRIDWLHHARDLDRLSHDWKALERRVRQRTALSAWDVLASWYRHYDGVYGGAPLVGIARRRGTLVGVAPLVITRGRVGRVPVTRVHFALHDAHAGEFLIEDGQPDIAGAFVDALPAAVKFDIACFNGLEPGSDCSEAVRDAAARRHLGVELSRHEDAIVDLGDGYDAYCQAMSRNFRRTIRRQRQRVISAGEPTISGVRLWSGRDRIEESIERLIAITEASYKLQGHRLADCHRHFLGDVARRFGRRGKLHLSVLSIDRTDAAVVMGVVERSRYYDVTLAYVEALAELSPGAYLMQEVLRDLAQAGVHRVTSHGAHAYKRRWATAFVPNTRVFLFASGARAAMTRFVRFRMRPLWRTLGAREP